MLRGLVLSMAAREHFPSPIFPSCPSTYPLGAFMLRDGGAGLKRRTQLELTFGVLVRISSFPRGGGICFLLLFLTFSACQSIYDTSGPVVAHAYNGSPALLHGFGDWDLYIF